MKLMRHKFTALLLAATLALAGCVPTTTNVVNTPPPPPPPPSRVHGIEWQNHMTSAKNHMKKHDWDAAIMECATLFRMDPTDPELQRLYQTAREAQLADRARHLDEKRKIAEKQMQLETGEKETVPPTYGVRKEFEPRPPDQQTRETQAEQLLKKTVSMDLENAELSVILSELNKKTGIQFIADQTLLDNKRLTVKLENSPLKEVLDYLTHNLSISFFAGENVLWVTASGNGNGAPVSLQPMETKIYHLRKGISLPEADDIQPAESFSGGGSGGATGGRRGTPSRRTSGLGGLSNAAGGMLGGGAAGGGSSAAGDTQIEKIIDMFVPQVGDANGAGGSRLYFDRDTHVLIVRNTRENLRLLERIIAELDVTPRQVLIEARFIEVGVNDLRELGVEWALNSDFVTTKTGNADQTVIKGGSGTSFPTPVPTAGGFNLTYTGVLTDPMFSAVLHVLQTSGKSRTLAVPRVTTVNNRQARIRIGEDFRYFEQFERQSVLTTVTGTGGTPVYNNQLVPIGTPTLEELGIQLTVLPSVGADSDAITLTLAPQNKDFVRFENFAFGDSTGTTTGSITSSGGSIKLPIFTVSEIQTRVVVHSGETVVMGGLVRTNTLHDINKFPVLGDLPLIGPLFRRTSDTEKRSNLIIFVTATLIGYNGESLVPVR